MDFILNNKSINLSDFLEHMTTEKNNEPIIVVFWHERIAVMSKIWPMEKPLAMLQSPHSDGQLIAKAINHLGFQTVWGSTNRNAVGGIRGLIKKAMSK